MSAPFPAPSTQERPSRRPPYLKVGRAGSPSTSRRERCKGHSVTDFEMATDPNPASCSHQSLCTAGKTSGVPMVSVFVIKLSLRVVTSCLPADKFDPDRFIDDRVKKYFVPNPFIFLPFNAGPRICIGQQVLVFSNFLPTSHADPAHPV